MPNNDAKLTAAERAKNIVHQHVKQPECLIQCIEKALEQAATEAREEALQVASCAECFAKGASAMREACARTVEVRRKLTTTLARELLDYFCEEKAKEIRSLPLPGGGGAA